jgi:sugar lactone lactonase YvrE
MRDAASHLAIAALLIVLVMTGLSGCSGGNSSSGGNTQSVAPSIASFTASPSTITAGSSATLSWSTANATSLSIDNSVGTVAGTSVSVKPSATTTYKLTATNSAGTSVTAQTTVTVTASSIASFKATPSILNPVTLGTTTATLSWSVTNAAAVSIDHGIGTVTGSSITVTPTATTTYTLTVTNAEGASETATVTVGVRNNLAVLAGVPYPGADVDGTGTSATFGQPEALAADASGNLYVADSSNNEIRKVTPAGVVTTIASGAALTDSSAFRSHASHDLDGNTASSRLGRQARMRGPQPGARYTPESSNSLIKNAGLNNPLGIAVSSDGGTIYVADTGNEVIRKIVIASDGTATMSTFAGTVGVLGTADGTGAAASFIEPMGIALDAAGNLYVADFESNSIRKITAAGVVTTLAGGNYGQADGTGSAAAFGGPKGITVDASGNVYVTEVETYTLRRITPQGVVTTLGRDGKWASTYTSPHYFDWPEGVAVDASGNLYVAETFDGLITEITPAGVISTLAGGGSWASPDGNGTGTAANFIWPEGITADASGNLYVADSRTIRKIIPSTAVVSTLAGTEGTRGATDGTGSTALFGQPEGITVDANGNIYVADMGTSTIRKITPEDMVTTLAGTAGTEGHSDGTGSAASFDLPQGITVDTGGNLFVTDYFNNTIREITPGGVVTTLAGTAGTSGSADGTGTAARFNSPWGIAVDASDNVYVADTNNNTIRKISLAGVVTTLAGTAGKQGHSDGTGTAASFVLPEGIAVDANGNVYVADTGNNAIRKITPEGVVTTLAGTAATINGPIEITVDASGNLYVVGTNTISKITPEGVVTTIIGAYDNATFSTGLLPASLYAPGSVAADSTGNLYITVPYAVLTLEP